MKLFHQKNHIQCNNSLEKFLIVLVFVFKIHIYIRWFFSKLKKRETKIIL
nr:MAG TPA: hypothetical protein [Bacteriophage sp.]